MFAVESLYRVAGLRLDPGKTEGPVPQLTVLGLHVDARLKRPEEPEVPPHRVVGLPYNKVLNYTNQITEALDSDRLTSGEAQRLGGR